MCLYKSFVWSFHEFTTRKTKKGQIRSINPTLNNIKKEFLKSAKGDFKEHLVNSREASGFIKLGTGKTILDVMATELKEQVLEDIKDTGFEYGLPE